MAKMYISKITADEIRFNNGSSISCSHEQECCECNYADFPYLRDEGLEWRVPFDEDLIFEPVHGYGFRFGNPGKMFFVPCYSEQNGYYTSDLTIIYARAAIATKLEECYYLNNDTVDHRVCEEDRKRAKEDMSKLRDATMESNKNQNI